MANPEINKILGLINKQYGGDTAHFLTEDFIPKVSTTSTGSLTLDLALGRGGIPDGRIVEIYGPSMSGKTTICFLHLAQCQKEEEENIRRAEAEGVPYAERFVAFIDAEHAFDPKLAAEYGVNLEKLIYINPKTAENAIDTADALIRSGKVRCIVTDSVSSLVPTKIAESSIEQQTIGLLARFMSTTMQKLTGIAYEQDCTLIFINQVREKIGGFSPVGTPETTSGGRALPFYSSVRLHVRMGDKLKNKDEIYGHIVKVKVTKNKVGVPFKEATFPLIYGHGVDRADEISQLVLLAGIIRQAGAWFRYEDEEGNIIVRDGAEMKWQGRAAFADFIRNNPFFMMELEDKLRGVEVEAPEGEAEPEEGYSDVINSDELAATTE